VRYEDSLIAQGDQNLPRTNKQSIRLVILLAMVSLLLVLAMAFLLARTLMSLYEKSRLAIQSRDDLIAVISHDLKNPIAAAILNSELILNPKLSPDTSERVRQIVLKTRTALERANLLIGGLLELNKIEVGHAALEKHRIDLGELIEESVFLIQPLAEAKCIHLHQVKSIRIFIEGDRGCLLRVLSNLLGNAVKFTPDGGDISIQAEVKSGNAVVSVQDSGPGIRENDLPHIFDRYWQARATAKKGTGLGLAIAKGFVEAHGGMIGVESHPGKGARFYFTIPLSRGYSPRAA
jgi:signal transduction histidine kinase